MKWAWWLSNVEDPRKVADAMSRRRIVSAQFFRRIHIRSLRCTFVIIYIMRTDRGVSSTRQATPTMDDLFTQRHLLILLLVLLVIFGGPKLKALLVNLGIM